jgi:hypothetical protein
MEVSIVKPFVNSTYSVSVLLSPASSTTHFFTVEPAEIQLSKEKFAPAAATILNLVPA